MCLKLGCSGMGRWGGGVFFFFFFFFFHCYGEQHVEEKEGNSGDTWTHTHITQIYWCLFLFFKNSAFWASSSVQGKEVAFFFFFLIFFYGFFSLWAPWLNTCSHKAAPRPHVDLAKLKLETTATTGKTTRHLKGHCVVFGYIWIFMIFTRKWYWN